MGWFLRFGNWSVAKLMEVLYGSCSLSDVGCTYRALHRQILPIIYKHCKVQGSHFGPEMMIATIRAGLRNVQLPVNYKERVGVSSVTGNLWVAFKLGLRMVWLIASKRLQKFKN